MDEVSIRDRKRQLTTAHILAVAEDMAYKYGPLHVKVDDIAEAAAISRRTFFNYFRTKEDAILGLQEPTLTPQALERFETSRQSLLMRTVYLIVDVNKTILVDGMPRERRKALVLQYPELKARFDTYISMSEQLIRPVIHTYANENDTEVLLRLSGAILRYVRNNIDPEFKEDSIQTAVKTFLQTINKVS